MATISEDYVSFETAKLLKEKGFDEKCSFVWMLDKANNPEDTDGVYKVASPCFMEGGNYVLNEDIDRALEYYDEYYHKDAFLCPTLQMAMKWLREVHNISIETTSSGDMMYDDNTWECDIKCNHRLYFRHITGKTSYEDVCEAAIKYCLENLI